MTTLDRCPGNELNKSVSIFNIACKSCGKENEVFADEIKKSVKCTVCGEFLDTSEFNK